MFIVVDKQNYIIIDTLSTAEIVSNTWVKSTHGSLIQLDTVDVVAVQSIPESAKYYKDDKFTSYNPIEHEQIISKYIEKVKELVKLKYPDSDSEIAILRKYTAGIDTKNEFEEYNTYIEGCKLQAKQELGLI